MKQNRVFSILRFFEHIGLIVFLSGLLFFAGWYLELFTAPTLLLGIVLGISTLGICLFIFTVSKITNKIDLLHSQGDFAINAQFLTLFERSPVPYIMIDREGVITKINPVGVKLLRSQVGEVANTNLLNRFVASDQTDVSIIVHKLKSGVTLTDIEVALQPDLGEPIWVLLSSYTSPHNKESFVSLVDVTQAKKVDIAKSEFLALATHQLRTPIAAIRWNMELLAKKIPEAVRDTTNRYVTKVQNNTERMSALIDDFLNVSKLELGTFATRPKEIHISSFVDTILDEFSQKLEEKYISLQRDDQPADFTLTKDERLLHIVFSNLLSNATKYVKQSGTIQLTTRVQENNFIFKIADDGIGVPKDEVDKLFTKFYRASNASKHQAEGTGLGLYVVKQAVELLGGTIALETDADQGAVFVVSLPV